MPVNTYRLQMNGDFGFRDALGIVDYLDDLGITDVYLSPILRATADSTHGYDVVDPTELDPKLGTREDFEAFSDALRGRGMGLILDIVPNHMAASTENPWWHDVLQCGQDSPYADFFDINWRDGDGRLLLPVLGAPLADVLAAGELTLERGEVRYYGQAFPLAPETVIPSSACDATMIEHILNRQHYRLAHWREQATRINYRRFFDISGLVAMRVERDEVFDAMHGLVLDLVRQGRVTGLRVDHVDGLHDPAAYLERLQAALREASGRDEPFWVVVEKVLNTPVEALPAEWPVAGTTGYDFLDATDGVAVHETGARRLRSFYDELTGARQSFHNIVVVEKRRVMRTVFGSELRMLARLLSDVIGDHAFTIDELVEAVVEVTTHLPVYRTYADTRRGLSAADEAFIEGAAAQAPQSRAVRALRDVLLRDIPFIMRWQQFTGPVTAKAIEDTAFYCYYALLERNEVGAHPDDPVMTAADYEAFLARRAQAWPHTMNTTSTHDTKRSEDVRARLAALTHMDEDWMRLVRRLRRRYREPDVHDGYLVYATLVAMPQIEPERLRDYLLKAAREAKRNTSWTDQRPDYEQRLVEFAQRVRHDPDLIAFAERIAEPGRQLALQLVGHKLVAPGVCDIYQGSEIEQLALVDPDNRRPVDFDLRREMLARVDAGEQAPGLEKLRVVAEGLRARRTAAGV